MYNLAMKREILEKNIYYYTNVIDNPEKLVEAIENTENENCDNFISKWQSWLSYDGQPFNFGVKKIVYPVAIKNFDNPDDSNANYIFSTICNAFYRVSKDYSSCLLGGKELPTFLRFSINKYRAGAHMGTHADQYDTTNELKYSMVMYLNDDYDGGEISFVLRNENKVLDSSIPGNKPSLDYEAAKIEVADLIGIKPEAGSVVMFPSYPPYHHTAHTVNSGNKYMITTFSIY